MDGITTSLHLWSKCKLTYRHTYLLKQVGLTLVLFSIYHHVFPFRPIQRKSVRDLSAVCAGRGRAGLLLKLDNVQSQHF